MFNYQDIIDKYYATQPELRRIYMLHCRSVADKALAIAAARHLRVDMAEVEAAAMLHDIGIVLTDAPGIHSMARSHILRTEGLAPTCCGVKARLKFMPAWPSVTPGPD